jgi:signal transduction histidine kinase
LGSLLCPQPLTFFLFDFLFLFYFIIIFSSGVYFSSGAYIYTHFFFLIIYTLTICISHWNFVSALYRLKLPRYSKKNPFLFKTFLHHLSSAKLKDGVYIFKKKKKKKEKKKERKKERKKEEEEEER